MVAVLLTVSSGAAPAPSEQTDNPLNRFRSFLLTRSWWSKDAETELIKAQRSSILAALNAAEKQPRGPIGSLFDDTWQTRPAVLEEQRQELQRLLRKYGEDWEPWRKEIEKHQGGLDGIESREPDTSRNRQ